MIPSLDELRRLTEPTAARRLFGSELDDAAAGATLALEAGSYFCPMFVERALTLQGPTDGYAVLAGEPGKPLLEVCADGAEVVLERLVFRGGCGIHGALAITAVDARVTVRDCLFLDATAPAGGPSTGGASLATGSLTLEGCLFAGNRGATGGALLIRHAATLEARSCLFVANASARGGGAAWVEEEAKARLVNCTLVDNTSDDGGMAFTLQAMPSTGRTPTVELVNCVVRSGARCFGYDGLGTGPILARASVLPEHAREYGALEADDVWFGEPTFAEGGFPFALATGAAGTATGDPGAWGEAPPRDLEGAPFEGDLPRGALTPQ